MCNLRHPFIQGEFSDGLSSINSSPIPTLSISQATESVWGALFYLVGRLTVGSDETETQGQCAPEYER